MGSHLDGSQVGADLIDQTITDKDIGVWPAHGSDVLDQ